MPYNRLRNAVYPTAFVIASSLTAQVGMAQTRFEIPDTTPNYAAYQYADECLTAVRRLDSRAAIKDTIWHDTLPVDASVVQRPVAPAAIEHGRSCLAKVNVDTVRVSAEEFNLLGRVLLMVNRDDDMQRLILRALDSAKNATEWGRAYSAAVSLYSEARPIRTGGLQQMLHVSSPYETPKDAEVRQLSLRVQLAISALTLGDTTVPREVVDEVLQKLRTKAIEKEISKQSSFLRGQALPLASEMLLDQAMDSLKVSTKAYRKFLEQLWYTFTDASFSDSREKNIGERAPAISGTYWYRNGWKVDTNGQLQLSKDVVQIDSQVVPVPGKVNAIVVIHGGCHALSPQSFTQFVRRVPGGNCWANTALAKRLKRQFPQLEVTVVTKTFGSFGGGLPLAVNEEAKLLSNYILGFFQLPATQAISETEFIRMPGLDRRRLDIPVSFENDYREIYAGDLILVDEAGQIFHNVTVMPSLGRMELTVRKKLQAVFSRAQ